MMRAPAVSDRVRFLAELVPERVPARGFNPDRLRAGALVATGVAVLVG
jgi:hypothetical protein